MQSGITEITGIDDATHNAAQRLDEAVQSGPQVAAEHDYGAQYSTRVTLHKPLARASREMPALNCLYLREPKAGDLRGVRLQALLESDVGALLTLLPRVAMPRLAPEEAARLCVTDTVALFAAVSRFLD